MLISINASCHYCLLRIRENPSAGHASSCMLEWNAMFECQIVGSAIVERTSNHKVIAELARLTGSPCKPILPYCFRKYGGLERPNRDLLLVLKVIVTEMSSSVKK